MSNYKVTYLLGAGASYHSIPVVNTLNERMKLFYSMFFSFDIFNKPVTTLQGYKSANQFYCEFKGVHAFLEDFRTTFEEAIEHRTIDTFARKLFLKKDEKRLSDLKKFLALYFAFEQSNEPVKAMQSSYEFSRLKKEEDSYANLIKHIKCTLDYRYDVFFASLLNEQMELPENVNIISWNYDHQLEMGYQNYTDYSIHECQEKLAVFPRGNSIAGKVIKLNGSAHQYYDSNKETYLFNRTEDNIYKSILDSFSDDVLKNREFALNFAWEKGPNQIKAIELAEGILSYTDELVIIGYSFPYFNRDVDIKLLMSSLEHVKRIKVMVHPNDFDSVKQSIQDIIGKHKKSLVPELHNDLDQFYIPSKFFGNPDQDNELRMVGVPNLI